jgi:hypothetical protein
MPPREPAVHGPDPAPKGKAGSVVNTQEAAWVYMDEQIMAHGMIHYIPF